MEREKILVIDDEMHQEGAEASLALNLKIVLEGKNFSVEFAKNGKEALEIIKKDKGKEIKLVLLDIEFKGGHEQWGQGEEIFDDIRKLQWEGINPPIAIITKKTPTKYKGQEDFFRKFCIKRSSCLYLYKESLDKRGEIWLNQIEAIIRSPKDIKYILISKEGLDEKDDEILDVDILCRESRREYSILKAPKRIRYPMCAYVEECIERFPGWVRWRDVRVVRENMKDFEFHKALFKLNDAIGRSSAGRIPQFLERGERRGCRLTVDEIKK